MKSVPGLGLLLALIVASTSGCGVVAGTIIDSTVDVATYPVKEYVCWGAYKYDNVWDAPYKELPARKDHGEILLGVTVTGGGSRSAYFLACVLQALSRVPAYPGAKSSVLEELDYISSVSGGSLASAYYCLKGFAPGVRRDRQFFEEFKEAMARDYEIRALARFALGYWLLDLFTYYDRGDLLAAVWDSNLFEDARFRDLAAAERRGAPTLIINGTSLTDGLKFVFSTLPDTAFNDSALFDSIRGGRFIEYATASNVVPFKTAGFQSLDSDIRPYPISKAVVASASVPNLLGPVTLRDRRQKDRLVHISDGGIYDNYGIESVMQVFTRALDKAPGGRARIIVVDGSGYFEEKTEVPDQFGVAYYSERPLEIAWLRAKSYMEHVFSRARAYRNEAGEQPYAKLDFELLSLYDRLPSQVAPQRLVKDKALQKFLRPDLTATDFLKKITTIQTRFKIGEDDAAVIDEVAKAICQRLADEAEEPASKPGAPPRERR